MNAHLSSDELEAFVVGFSASDQEARLQQHVRLCAECAERLAREAELQARVAEVGAHAARVTAATAPSPSRRVRWAIAFGAPALAAGLLLAVWLRKPPSAEPTAAIAPVVCPDGDDQMRCVERAHDRGLLVQYPGWAGAPRFGQELISANDWDFP
jgi:hypothetical protein